MATTKNLISNPLICKVEYAFTDEVESESFTGYIGVVLSLKAGKTFKPIYATHSITQLVEEVESSSAGLLHKQKLSLHYPGLNPESQPDIIILERQKLIVLVHFQNEVVKVIGSKENPAKAFVSLTSNDSTGHAITIQCISDEMAKFLLVE